MLRLTPKTDLFQSYIEVATTILSTNTVEEVRQQMETLQKLLSKLQADEKRNTTFKLRCQIDIVASHLLLCDIRRLMLGCVLTMEEGKLYDARSKQLIEWTKNTKSDDVAKGQVIYSIYYYLNIVCKVAHVVKVEDEIKANNSITMSAFYLIIEIQKLKSIVKESELEKALTILTEDREPKTDAEKFLYNLTRLAVSKLFAVRAQFVEMQTNDRVLTLKNRNYLSFIDAILTHCNLHEFPMCRAKYSLHTRNNKFLERVQNEEVIDKWQYVRFGILKDQNDNLAFQRAVTQLLSSFEVLDEMYQKYLALLQQVAMSEIWQTL